jgi:transcriptional activator HAC1
VLRNRRAAQSSRERKRLEVEGLEKEKREIEQRNHDLERRLHEMELRNNQLQQQLAAVTGGNMHLFGQAATTSDYTNNPEPLRCTTPVTFSKELFESRDTPRNMSSSTQYRVQTSPHTVRTVNPASLSPEMRPTDQSNRNSSDMTQHPAVSVGRAALDIFGQQPQYFGNSVSSNAFSSLSHHDISYLNGHDSYDHGVSVLEDGINPPTDNFNIEFDNMASYNTNYVDNFNLADYLHQDENSRSVAEIRTSDSIVEKTLGLQSPIGASFIGCDSGSNAVSV